MSHNIEYYVYGEKVDKKRVQAELDNYVAHADWGEGASGLPNPIRWEDYRVYEDRETAEKAIEDADKKRWYNCMAVKFKEYAPVKQSKAISEIAERVKKATENYQKIVNDARVQNRTSTFIGCPKCGSQLKRELIQGQFCPLCRTDLRSNTNIERIKNADQKIKELQKKHRDMVLAEEKKGKPTVKWLVKIEYHT